MKELITQIENWVDGNGLYNYNPLLQTIILNEEVSVLQRAIFKAENNTTQYLSDCDPVDDYIPPECIIDIKIAIGDIFISLVMLSIQVKELDINEVWKDNCAKHHDVRDYGFTSFQYSTYMIKEIAEYQLLQDGYRHSGAEEIGNIIVYLYLIAEHHNLLVKECVDYAYEQFKAIDGIDLPF